MAKSLRVAYGEALVELGENTEDLIVLDADLAHATQTWMFAEKFPERFINMGIAETNLACVAAGLAHSGFTPFASTFALFGAGRAYEQVRNSIAYTNANVKLGLSHSGLSVGEDGGSHQAVEDISLMRTMPNMKVIVPADATQMKKAVQLAYDTYGPVYIRVARPVTNLITDPESPCEWGSSNLMKNGDDICLISCGLMLEKTLEAADILEEKGISTAVVDMYSIKPIDKEIIKTMARQCKGIVTAEEHSTIGGLGSAVAEVLVEKGACPMRRVGIKDSFGRSGKPNELFEMYGLTAENIVSNALDILNQNEN